MGYVTGAESTTETALRRDVFLSALESAADPDSLVVYLGTDAFVIMNLFPYNTGHMMVVPKRRVAALDELSSIERAELMELVNAATEVGSRVLACDGFNIGLNIGAVAGAGIAEHLHFHIVPRWLGDANFMPIAANTMVLPELLPATTARIKGEFAARAVAQAGADALHSTAGALTYLVDEQRFVLRRAADGTIVIPKGHIEAGESAAAAATREVWEETGFRATVTNWGGIEQFEHHDENFHVVYFVATGQRTPEAEDHLKNDTILVASDEVVGRLSFESSRAVARRALEVLELTEATQQ